MRAVASPRVLVRGVAGTLCLLMFATDIVTPPLNVSLCWGYCTVVLLALLDQPARISFVYALATTVLAVVGAPLGPQSPDDEPIYIANRAIAVVVAWLIAAAIYHRKLGEALARARLQAEQVRNRGYRQDLTGLTYAIMRRLTIIDGHAHRIGKRADWIDRAELATRVGKMADAARDIGQMMKKLQHAQQSSHHDAAASTPPQL